MKKVLSCFLAVIVLAAVFASALPAAASDFTDVEKGRWSERSIQYSVRKGYMKGTGNGEFSPEDPMTREMVATVLWRRQGSPESAAPSGFDDVKTGEWYSDAVAWARETGVVNGVSEKLFEPDRNVTREQLATMLVRYSVLCPVSIPDRADLSAFPDSGDISDWAEDAMGWAVEAALIQGTDGGRLDPGGFATREQFAAVIERFDGSFNLSYTSPVLRSSYTEPDYPLVNDADFYVSPTGSDSNDGSFERPFATWQRAVEAVRGIDKTGKDGVTVAFMAGEYGSVELELTDRDAGVAECPITYCKYGDGDVIFRNGVRIPLSDFEPLDDGDKFMFQERASDRIRKVNVKEKYGVTEFTDNNELFNDSGRLTAARYPNQSEPGVNIYLRRIQERGRLSGPHRDNSPRFEPSCKIPYF